MIFVGVDWAEAHHDYCVMDEAGSVLVERRVPDNLEGVAQLHADVGEQAESTEVVVGVETDRGLFIGALIGAGYQVYDINPLAASRYRDRHRTSGAKSDTADAKMLADLVRTDRHNHRRCAGDSELAHEIKLLARAHQNAVWSRQDHANALRSTLREYFPAALEAFRDLTSPDATAILVMAPTPELAKRLSRSKIEAALRRAGRTRQVPQRAEKLQQALRQEHLRQPSSLENTYGIVTKSHAGLIEGLNREIASYEEALSEHFEVHPDAEILNSLPGLGVVLGARMLGEFGDDPNRYSSAKSRKNYAGVSPITKSSGKSLVVVARHSRNRRLSVTCERWAFCSLTASPGAKAYYHQLRDRGKSHGQALRQLANRLVGILHFCLERRCIYSEEIAWPNFTEAAA